MLPRPPRRVVWAGLIAGVVLATAVCCGVALQMWTVGSAEGGWTYPYVAPLALRHVMVFAAVAAGACLLLAVPVRPRTTMTLLAAWMVFATAAHALIRTTAPFDFEGILLSPGAYSFYTLAQEHEPSEILASFNRIQREAPLHAQSNMPGKTLLVHALQVVTTRTDMLPWVFVLLSNLGAVLMFGLARALFGDDRAALHAAVLYLFMPARVLFFPLMNTITPLFILAFAWLIVRWLRTGGLAYAVAAGATLYALAFFDPLPLVMGLFFAALGMAAMARGEIGVERFVVHAGVMALVFGATSALVFEGTGFHLWRAFRGIAAHAVEFNEAAGRPYSVWVRENLREFVFAMGPAQFALAVTALWTIRVPAAPWRERLAPIGAVTLGLFAVLIVTDLLGVNRGEVSRLWIFLGCFFQLPAAYLCAALDDRRAVAAVLVVTLLQTCLASAAIGFVVP